MIYQLPNGRVVKLSIETYLKMTDEDLRYLNEINIGSTSSDDPFVSEEEAEPLDIISEEYIEDLPAEFDIPDDSSFEE
jgi:hypothetical protein